uniref:Uncharacterized protein n=1 Tax=Oryzias melastigma TaxID=30732 RepID=A0A3B3C877_ORYME
MLEKNQHKISLYTNYVFLYITKPSIFIPKLIELIQQFGKFLAKTNVLTSFPFRSSQSGFGYLGIQITPIKPPHIYEENMQTLHRKIPVGI